MSIYPESALELVTNKEYSDEVIAAMKEFRGKHIWRIPLDEKIVATQKLFSRLCELYKIEGATLECQLEENAQDSFASRCTPDTRTVTLVGKYSVITFLHEFAHLAFGASETKAVAWSINLFKIIFPRSFSRLDESGHTLIRHSIATTNE